jgi:Fur family ferric uptake transcriptional regulator|tara:strand:- start:27 stop:461 length:435 start_codon:yes stop_codon:yes gene_type:complete
MEFDSKKILSKNKVSITNPRIIVLETLLELKKPIAIDDLYTLVKNKVAKSTFYRVLNDLKEISILQEFNSPDNVNIVELVLENTQHHHHLFCNDCGEIVDIHLSNDFEEFLENEVRKLQQKVNYLSIENHSLELFGKCSGCKNN